MSVRGSDWIDDVSREELSENHDGPRQRPVSKKRKVLSCYACRDRKMRCDRLYPVCGRCEKTGRASQCTYDPRLIEEFHIEGTASSNGLVTTDNGNSDVTSTDLPSHGLESKIRIHERRIQILESKVAAGWLDSAPSRCKDQPEALEEMMFRSKGFKTTFHGATSIMSSIARFPELQVFTRKAWGIDHSIVAHFRVLRDRRKRLANERSGRSHLTDADVYRALPDEAFVKSQVVLYFRAWESTYRILHEPSFWQESDDFWGQRRDGKGSAAFAVILILIVAIMKCASPKEDVFVGDTTADREAAAELVQICTTWLGQQSRKHLTLSFFQIQCLLLLAKRANCVEMKQDWLNSGDLVRLALASGMHRDPALMVAGKISVYEKEMRKRLWATIMELELQSSIETGLQSSLTSLYFDTPAPTNLPDDAFSMECPQLPAPRSAEHFTSTSYLGLSQLSLPLRIHLAQLLNTPLKDIKYFDVLHYDEQIHAAISSLPSWNDIQAEVPSLLLQLQLQQYLLLLHKPYAKLARQNRYYVHSLTAIIDTASSMIAKYSAMISRGILVLNHFRNDILRVGITISSVVYENCLRHKVKPSSPADRGVESQFAEPDPHFYDVTDPERCDTPENSLYVTVLPIDPSLIRTFCITSLELLECTKQLYEQKVKRLGTGYMEYWLLSSAVEILPAPPSPTRSIDHVTDANEDPLARCRKTLDQFTTLTSHVLALQKDPQNRSASLIRKPVETLDNLASCANALESNTTPIMYDPFQFNATLETEPCLGNDIEGPFDTLQDTQIGLGDWSFPDFWAFDLGGEY